MAEVYRVKLEADFYVLADSGQEAERLADVYCALSDLELDLPVGAGPRYSAYRILRQDDEFRRRCANFEDRLGSDSDGDHNGG